MTNFEVNWLEIKDLVLNLRRELHQWPETANDEKKTQQLLLRILAENKLDTLEKVAGTGIVVTLAGAEGGPKIALRADMDALNVDEGNDLHYKSQRAGYMHACGHDAHMAILMGTLIYLKRFHTSLEGTVKFIFQPAEEIIGGAKPILESGALAEVSKIVALHLWPNLPEGTVGIKDGVFMASNDYFKMEIIGRASHGAMPNEGIDALYVATKLVQELKTLVAREVSPLSRAVISVGKFIAGEAYNIIPERAHLEGTVRTLDPDTREFLAQRIPILCEALAQIYGAEARVEYVRQYPVTVNYSQVNAIIEHAVQETGGKLSYLTEPSMVAEDFSFYTQIIPGAMFLLGTSNPKKGHVYPLHHSKFNFDDEVVLEHGVKILSKVALNLLRTEG